jgi:hypothetical protein
MSKRQLIVLVLCPAMLAADFFDWLQRPPNAAFTPMPPDGSALPLPPIDVGPGRLWVGHQRSAIASTLLAWLRRRALGQCGRAIDGRRARRELR